MRFDEAFKEMVDNYQPISRNCWKAGCLLYNEITNEIQFTYDSVSNWKPQYGDLTATDWEVI